MSNSLLLKWKMSLPLPNQSLALESRLICLITVLMQNHLLREMISQNCKLLGREYLKMIAIIQSKQQELHPTVQLEVTRLLARPKNSEICGTAHHMLLTPKGDYTISFVHFTIFTKMPFPSFWHFECTTVISATPTVLHTIR